jgi:GPH family glycoside/pentoside/hexuronide:cation symporter
MKPTGKLSVMTKMKYGVGDFGMAVVTAMLQFSMLFYYTDVVGVNPALAGTAMLVGKITWDLVNDTLFGYLEDKTKSRWGKRRPYLIFGALPFALSFWGVFSIPKGLGDIEYFFIIIGSFMLFDTFHTLTGTAYSAMTAEITEDYNERTSLSTYRMVFSIIGYLCGAGVSGTLAGVFSDVFGISIEQGWSLVALAFGVLGGISMLIPGLFLKYEPAVESKPSSLPPFKSIISTFKNKPFVMYIIITSIMSISFTMVTTMLQYYITHQLDMESSSLFVMVTMLGVLALFLVPCGILSNKIGKAKAYATGLTIASVALIFVFLMPQGPSPLIYVLAGIAGLGFSAQWVCPHSMIPDVIEYDELLTGERREGVYYGVHATSGKITGALASAACGWGLELGKYVENSAEQPESALLAIRILFALIPAIFLLICVPLLIKYPITKAAHAEVMKQLQERRAAKNEETAETK